MIEYAVIRAPSAMTLEVLVQDKVDEGWVPCGGICASGKTDEDGDRFYQALTREHTHAVRATAMSEVMLEAAIAAANNNQMKHTE